jgi:glycosyltransferase involved in cell wall biosynthesis
MDDIAPLTVAQAHVDDAGCSGRPLVTFALFAYNQEQFVREAIEAAFAQTYEPLEIILSDDCSSDRTFAIMQEMATAYTGPHRVIARQSPQNRRVLRHVLDVARLAQGKYMVVAAGDDISMPQRTDRLVELFEREEADFCWSAYRMFGDSDQPKRVLEDNYALEAAVLGLPVRRIYGASAAYRVATVQRIPDITRAISYEDTFLEIFAALSGRKVSFCPDELIAYRVLAESLSMKISADGAAAEANLSTHYQRLGETALLAIESFCTPDQLANRPELARFRDLARFYQAASGWRELSVPARLRLLLTAPDAKALKWLLPRALLGWNLFVRLKNLQLRLRG